MKVTKSDALVVYALGLIALGLSYSALVELATASGLGRWQALAWPLAVDGLILAATRAAVTFGDHPGRRYAWGLLGASGVASIAANAVHAILPHGAPAPLPVTIAVGITPPIVALAVTHLAVVRARVRRDQAAAETLAVTHDASVGDAPVTHDAVTHDAPEMTRQGAPAGDATHATRRDTMRHTPRGDAPAGEMTHPPVTQPVTHAPRRDAPAATHDAPEKITATPAHDAPVAPAGDAPRTPAATPAVSHASSQLIGHDAPRDAAGDAPRDAAGDAPATLPRLAVVAPFRPVRHDAPGDAPVTHDAADDATGRDTADATHDAPAGDDAAPVTRRDRAIAMRRAGLSNYTIAANLEVSEATVRRMLAGVPRPGASALAQ